MGRLGPARRLPGALPLLTVALLAEARLPLPAAPQPWVVPQLAAQQLLWVLLRQLEQVGVQQRLAARQQPQLLRVARRQQGALFRMHNSRITAAEHP